MQTSAQTLDRINYLCTQRQGLWRAKWTRRNAPEYSEELKSLNYQIDRLWKLHRAEMAGRRPLEPIPRKVDPEIAADYLETYMGISVSVGTQVKVGDKWKTVPDAALAAAVERYTKDVPSKDRVDKVKTVPLREILARRGSTLEFHNLNSRNQYATERLISP